jgi:hypothetical protein
MRFIKCLRAVVICPRPKLLTVMTRAEWQAVEIRSGLAFVMDFDRMRATD